VMLADNIVERSIRPMVDAFADPRGPGSCSPSRGARAPPPPRACPSFGRRPGGADRREARGSPSRSYAVTGIYCYDADVFEVIPTLVPRARRARDHRREQPLRRARGDGLRRPRGLLGRRRRVDRRLLRGERLRPGPRRQQGPSAAASILPTPRTQTDPSPVRTRRADESRDRPGPGWRGGARSWRTGWWTGPSTF
jgi:hypothetical protein